MTRSPKSPRIYRVLELVPGRDHASKPAELIQIRGHDTLTLNARRAITLLWHNAHRQGIEENKDYTIEIEALMPQRHKGYEMVEEAIEALMTTLIVIRSKDGDTRRVQVLGGNDLGSKTRPAGVLTYSFDRRLIEILRDSRIWGRISLPQLMAFGSKYAVTLYEHLSQWTGLSGKTHEVFELGLFREILGVEDGKYMVFGALNQQVIKPVTAEINALAPFNMALIPLKTGKKVTHVRLSWWPKTIQEQKDAFEELNRSRVGRRVRIASHANMVLPASPSPERIARGAKGGSRHRKEEEGDLFED